MKADILEAARAIDIPEGESGLWSIDKITFQQDTPSFHGPNDRFIILPAGTYTHLRRVMAKGTTVVMEDTPLELKTHLNFMLRARGQVLVTGLGLGCVVRGLLANPNVKHVTCLEKSSDVMRLVFPHMPDTRKLFVYELDAFEWAERAKPLDGFKYDYVWHDIWADRENGDPHLDSLHMRLFKEFRKIAKHQGMWRMDRTIKSQMKHMGMEVI